MKRAIRLRRGTQFLQLERGAGAKGFGLIAHKAAAGSEARANRSAPMKPSTHNVTLMLKQLNQGNQDVVSELVPLLYDELRRLAGHYLRRERGDHTLQPTALVHEAYLRLVDQKEVHWQNRSHFFGIAA